MALLQERDDFFVGLGHPRCGTGFAASLLQSAGLDVGHERVCNNGIVSWMLAGERYRNPFYDALGSLEGYRNIFCVARSPLASIPSIIPENRIRRSFKWRMNVLKEKTSEDPLQDPATRGNQMARAVLSYTLWFELSLRFNPRIIFRVDVPADDAVLSRFVGHEVARSPETARNSRPDVRYGGFSPDMLVAVPSDLLRRFSSIASELGYPSDAATIMQYAI
jgi:hypothetical protein